MPDGANFSAEMEWMALALRRTETPQVIAHAADRYLVSSLSAGWPDCR
jgi:hypothetical protein